jgi:hypothetical protein
MLVIGYDESNQTIIASAHAKIKNSTIKQDLQKLYNEDMNSADINFLSEDIPLYVSYLALLFFVYAALVATNSRNPPSTNIGGLVMDPELAIGWAYCLLNYYNNEYNVDSLGDIDAVELSIAIDIISIEIASRYLEYESVTKNGARITAYYFRGIAPWYSEARDIMYVADRTLDEIVSIYFINSGYIADKEALMSFDEPISYITKINKIIGHPDYHRVYDPVSRSFYPVSRSFYYASGGRKQSKRRKRKY